MTVSQRAVSEHYTTDALLDRIREAVREAGGDPSALTNEAIKPVDEFHTGGLVATDALLEQLTITPETRVLDIGSGLGGTARHIASTYGATVSGVDLTETYVNVATALSADLGLQDKVAFKTASATDLPFEDASFDLATMFHVGMNIADKKALFANVARVLAPGGTFALYDVMATSEPCVIPFPVPWAERAELSAVMPPETYRAAGTATGLTLKAERSRLDFALGYFKKVFDHVAVHGMPPVGIHLLMRDTAPQKLKNFVAAMKDGQIAPFEMIFQKAAA